MITMNRGGRRDPSKLVLAQSRLLFVLWNINGGATEIARALGFDRQKPINWKNRGRVPLQYVGRVSRRFKVPPEALNYEQVVSFRGHGKPFAAMLKKLNLTEDDKRFVLEGKRPRKLKDILADG